VDGAIALISNFSWIDFLLMKSKEEWTCSKGFFKKAYADINNPMEEIVLSK